MNQPAAEPPYVAIDLFAGAGGLTLGFEQAGIKVLACVERDPLAANAHRRNFPHCPVLEDDIHNITSSMLLSRIGRVRGDVDVVIGGPPCQGFSYAGRRDHQDPRNALTLEFVRLVRGIRPKAFVMENVPGLASIANGTTLNELVRALSPSYNITLPWQILTAADYGVPQNRRRLFLLGCRKDIGGPIPYPERTHIPPGDPAYQYDTDLPWHSVMGTTPEGKFFCPTVADALHDLPQVDNFQELIEADAVAYPMSPVLAEYAAKMRSGKMDTLDHATPRPDWDPTYITNCKRTNHDSRITSEFSLLQPGEAHPSRRGKLLPWGLAPTIRAGTNSDKGSRTALRPIHYDQPRVITVREGARLMGFPDWVAFHETKWHGFRLVGSAVPPQLARAVALNVRAVLHE